MDNITHTLVGITLGRTPLGRAGRGTTAALVLASNLPDVDIVTAARGATAYIHWHRGPTHGPIGILGLGVLSAGLVWLWDRYDRRRRPDQPPLAPFATLALVGIVGVLFHVLMDLPTSYGTRLLSPFDWHWYSLDWMPIIDVYLLVALGAGLFFGRHSAAAKRRNAAIVLLLMAVNYGIRGVSHARALAAAPALFGPTLPDRCPGATDQPWLERWPRPPVDAVSSGRRCLVELAAMPSFASPFSWRIVVRMSNAYELTDADLLALRGGAAPWRVNRRYPNIWTPAAFQAAKTDGGQVLLGFSRFAAVRAFEGRDGTTTVRFTDMRFAGGRISPNQSSSRPDPFTLVVRIDRDGRVISEALTP